MGAEQRIIEGSKATDHAHAGFKAFGECHQVTEAHYQRNHGGTEEDRLEQFVAVMQQQPAATKEHEGVQRSLEQVGVGAVFRAPEQADQGPGGEGQERERQGLAQQILEFPGAHAQQEQGRHAEQDVDNPVQHIAIADEEQSTQEQQQANRQNP